MVQIEGGRGEQGDILSRPETPLVELFFNGLDSWSSLVKRDELPSRLLTVRAVRHINNSKLEHTSLKA